jgi:hypothetical protein
MVTSLTAVSGPRPSRPDGGRQRRDGRPAAAGPQQSGGRLGETFLPREECAQRAQGKKLAARPLRDLGWRPGAKPGERIAAPDPPAAGRRGAVVPTVKGVPLVQAHSPRDPGPPVRTCTPHSRPRKARFYFARSMGRPAARVHWFIGRRQTPRCRGPEEHHRCCDRPNRSIGSISPDGKKRTRLTVRR